ncbi:MAG: DegQ family serine endoprotease [Planctomycetota bacterium]|nr:DegQ family serine endoprotease [Planctomycetota bacterium]
MKNQSLALSARRIAPLSALAVIIAAGGLLTHQSALTADAAEQSAQRTETLDSQDIQFANRLSSAFRNAAQVISPSVVNIAAIDTPDDVPARNEQRVQPDDPRMQEFFRRFFGEQMPDFNTPQPMPRERRGQGSGVIVSTDGYIITNNHVVDGFDEIIVRLQDGREYTASVEGLDPDTDLAVIRIEADSLTAASIGATDNLLPGDWVVAVGNPFGLDHTVTAGVVSAKGRAGFGLTTFEDFIQTDAAINPGNSGGPLINLRGEVVGINSAIRTQTGGSIGIGFAIPAETVRHVYDSIRTYGEVERGWLGVSLQEMTNDLARTFGLETAEGALVAGVLDGTPAAEAGVQSGDIITRIDRARVDTRNDLMNTIGARRPGETINLTILRDGDEKNVTVTLGKRPATGDIQSGAPAADNEPAPTPFGLTLQPLDETLADRLNLDFTGGAVIMNVEPGSAAERAGLRRGEVIVSVGGSNIATPADFRRALEDQDLTKGVRLKVRTAAGTRFVVLKQTN